jgi:hypothetical protein
MPKTWFYLLQIGEWDLQQTVCLTPLTIAQAKQRGYGPNFIEHQLVEATQQLLSSAQREQLLTWYLAADNYEVQAVYLFSSAQPDQLADIMKIQRLSRHIHQQISPRHAIVSPRLIQPLQRWLAKQNKFLQAPPLQNEATGNTRQDSAYTWLGLKLLVALKAFLALPIPSPHSLLDEVSAAISPEEQTELGFMVENVMQELKLAIRGKDIFLPALTAVPPQVLEKIQQAITAESALTIAYQALGDMKASFRRIQPMRLAQRGSLYYLYAYCYRTETNLTFRLDRIQQIESADGHQATEFIGEEGEWL